MIRVRSAAFSAAGGAFVRAVSAVARRRAWIAAGLLTSRAVSLRSVTSLPIAARVSAGVGSALISSGASVFSRKKLASSI
jgi:hypothetical protein